MRVTRLGAAASLAVWLWVPLGVEAQQATEPAADKATAQPTEQLADTIARRSLEALGSRPAEAERLLERNMSRYFVAFPLLAGADNRQAVLQATLRGTARFAGGVLMLATTDDNAVRREDITTALQQLLPQAENPWQETVFFPNAAAVAVETWDLRAMEATGTAWAALGFLVQQPIPRRLATATIADAAVDLLAEAAGAYALLVLRMAGEEARDGFDSYVRPRHVRDAVRRIGELRKAPDAPPDATLGAAPAGSMFTDVTAAAGVDFRHVSTDWISRFRRWSEDAPTFSGGGVAARDLDGDGWADLVFCGGAGCRLYRNLGTEASQGGPAFVDVTAASGLATTEPFEARMPLPADFDGDGDLDLFITVARDGNRLYRNEGHGDPRGEGVRFVDVTETSGLSHPGDVSGPAAAFDADGDGDLDLFVGNFGNYLGGASPWLSPDSRNGQPNRLFLNVGSKAVGLRFEEAMDAGVGDTGWAQAVSHFDHDGDGDQDLYVANDFGRNELLSNRGDGTFVSVGAATGGDDPFHGMNAAFADLDRDRLPDVLVTNIWTWNPADGSLGEANSLLLSQRGEAEGPVTYRNASVPSGLTEGDTGWAWGALFFDANHDGIEDLLVIGGLHDYNTFFQWRPHPDGGEQMVPTTHRREPNVFFRGLVPAVTPGGAGGVSFLPRFEVLADSGAELPGINARGLALADFDRDGDLDAAVSTFHDHARILRNDASGSGAGDWLQVELVGGPGGRNGSDGLPPVNRDAVGAVVVATRSGDSGELYAWRMATGGEGYLSASQRPLHFGLGTQGDAARVNLEITWPGGGTQTVTGIPANRRIRVRYGTEGFELLP